MSTTRSSGSCRAAASRSTLALTEAADGESAWLTLQLDRPDLVLLDVRFPGAGSLELYVEIKADPHLRPTKVILISGYGNEKDRKIGLGVGADAYVAKPYRLGELLALSRELFTSREVLLQR